MAAVRGKPRESEHHRKKGTGRAGRRKGTACQCYEAAHSPSGWKDRLTWSGCSDTADSGSDPSSVQDMAVPRQLSEVEQRSSGSRNTASGSDVLVVVGPRPGFAVQNERNQN